MMKLSSQTIRLPEHKPRGFPKEDIPEDLGKFLWQTYRNYVSVEEPSFKNEYEWQLTNQGWVGQIPLPDGYLLVLEPKVQLENLFSMLDYAYQLKSFQILDGLVDCHSIDDFYSRLANILAKNILDRTRKGLYRDYLDHDERLSYVRGRIDLNSILKQPWSPSLHCHYQDHTANIEENQILAWTLSCIRKSSLCRDEALKNVCQAYRILTGVAALYPYSPRSCIKRLYNRLNMDYKLYHALCRFFLEHSGPTIDAGDHDMVPFLVNMPNLFELFVSKWLEAHLPDNYYLRIQENVNVGSTGVLQVKIDLVLYASENDKPIMVLDTKYKTSLSSDDVQQVVAYAELMGCTEAVLLYPSDSFEAFDEQWGNIRVRSLAFSIEGDLEEAGIFCLDALIGYNSGTSESLNEDLF